MFISLDSESGLSGYYFDLATSLRAQFTTDPQHTYYLSAAPQCPFSDASYPWPMLQAMDFVWVQFYNNPACNANTPAVIPSLSDWSKALMNSSQGPMLYIGVLSFAGGGTGYTDIKGLETVIQQARKLSNFGGVMLWDGSEGLMNVAAGINYIEGTNYALNL
jgi:chitinase